MYSRRASVLIGSTLFVCSCTGVLEGTAPGESGSSGSNPNRAGEAVDPTQAPGLAGAEPGGSASTADNGSSASEPVAPTAVSGQDTPGVAPDGPRTVVPEPLHRLNRFEYNNTVRDLLGTSLRPADSFPPDPALEGFDNLAEGLSLTPSLFNAYWDAAGDLSTGALERQPRFQIHELAKDVATDGFPAGSGWSMHGSDIVLDFELPQAEQLTVRVSAGGTASQAPTPRMSLRMDGVVLQSFTVNASVAAPETYSVEADLSAGNHTLVVTFDNFQEIPTSDAVNTLVLQTIDIESQAADFPPSRALIQTCDPLAAADEDACYAEMLSQFARRAWRRDLTPEESSRLVDLWQRLSTEEGKENALSLAVRALLLTPQFLYRVSVPAPNAQAAPAEEDLVPLDDYSVASRISYFLWSSMPDDALLDAADARLLQDEATLSETVRRMLADPKASGLSEGFAAQWMFARKLQSAAPNPEVFPDFDEALREAMTGETKLFFADFIQNQQPLSALVTPDFNYLNDRLARHYGQPEPGSASLVRVTVAPGSRAGLVQQGAWLTAQSQPDRTSPVLRGRFLVEQLLCIDVPPPPPDVTPAMEAPPNATMRERLEAHRASPQCAGCHDILDPPGLGLEEFDAIGRKRDTENGEPIDTSGALPPDGVVFAGGAELAELVKADPRFYSCLTHKLMSYALGRGVVVEDAPFANDIVQTLDPALTTLDQLIERVVMSPVFRMRSVAVAQN